MFRELLGAIFAAYYAFVASFSGGTIHNSVIEAPIPAEATTTLSIEVAEEVVKPNVSTKVVAKSPTATLLEIKEKSVSHSQETSAQSETLTVNQVTLNSPEISNVRAIPSANTISIKWTTNVETDGEVTIWPTDTDTGNTKLYTKSKTAHEVKMSAYSNRTYYFVIESRTSDGRIAAVEQREVRTPSDELSPLIGNVSVARYENPAIIRFHVETDELSIIQIEYSYKATQDADMTHTVKSVAYSTNTSIDVPAPSGWVPGYSSLEYQVSAADRSGNLATNKSQTAVISDI